MDDNQVRQICDQNKHLDCLPQRFLLPEVYTYTLYFQLIVYCVIMCNKHLCDFVPEQLVPVQEATDRFVRATEYSTQG